MMKVTDNFYVKCNNCGHITFVEADSLDYDTTSSERSMGEEIEYNFYGEFCCKGCGRNIDYNIRGYEYPIGAFDYSASECHGGEFVDEPRTDIEYEFDDYFSDYVYEEYIEADNILERNREQIRNMTSREFELFVAKIFENLGFTVKVTQVTRDGGCDIISTKSDPIPFTLIVECKHWGENHKVDVSVVRSLYGVQTAMQANQSIVITSTRFTRDARKFAESRKTMMQLWDIDDLLRYMK